MVRMSFVAALAVFTAFCATPAMSDVGKPQESSAALAGASQPTKSGYIEANGLSYYYQVYGTGEPLLLLRWRGCTDDANPHAYVVAVERARLPERFTISVRPDGVSEECCPESETEVEL